MTRTVRTAAPLARHFPKQPKPTPTMTWAEMARSEGHRSGLRGQALVPRRENLATLLKLLRGSEAVSRIAIADALGIKVHTVMDYVGKLRGQGHKIETLGKGDAVAYRLVKP